MKIVRMILLLGAVAAIAPTPPEDPTNNLVAGEATSVESSEMMVAAVNVMNDARGFCQRNQNVCDVMGRVGYNLEAKLRYNIKLLYEWANKPKNNEMPSQISDHAIGFNSDAHVENFNPSNKIIDISPNKLSDPLVTGSTTEISDNTLLIDDLLPEWRGPIINQ